MADLDSQRLQQQVDDLTRQLNGLTRATGQRLTAEEKAAVKTQALSQAASGATTALGQFTSQLYNGVQGARVFTQALKTGVGAIAGASKGFEQSIGRNSKLVAGLQLFGIGVTEAADIVASMSDQLFNSFQSLTRVGAAGAEGMSGVFDQLQNFRLGLEDLKQLTDLFGQNAQSLVLFGGTVEQGAKSLGALRKFVTGSGLEQQFMGLGMNTQEINEAMAGFVAQQSRLGLRQVTDYAKVTQSLDAYIAEQDAITKLTGATRRQQEESAQKALAVEQFRAKIEQLKAKGDDASLAEANRLMSIFKGLDAVSTDLSAAFAASASGFVTKGAGVTGQIVAQGKLQEIVNNRNIQMAEALPMIGSAVESFNRGVGNTVAATGRYQEAFGANYGQLSDAVPILKDFGTNLHSVEDIQKRQRDRTEEGVKAQVELRTAQMYVMQNFQSLVNIGVVPATQALAGFAEQLRKTTTILPGGQPIGGGPRDSSIAEYATAGANAAGAVPFSGTAATGDPILDRMSGITGGLGGLGLQQRIIGGAIGATQGLLRQLGMGSPEINPDDVINFRQGDSGSRQHFDQLQPQVRERALAMAQAYKQDTGQKLNLTSAFRSAEEQAALAASGGQGPNPIAEPGRSLHQQGRALDFNSREVDFLEKMGLLQQYGFKRLQGDPPHIYMQDGGIATGPQSGYQATLHGTEAVVPLPDGKTIPVTMPGLDNIVKSLTSENRSAAMPGFADAVQSLISNNNTISQNIVDQAPSEMRDEMSRQSGLIFDQISRLDEIIALMRNQNGISTKILQASTN